MKNLILKFLFLFYKYYDKGSTKSIAYFSALTAFIKVLFLNVYTILIYFNIYDKYLTFSYGTSKWQKYLWATIFLLPFYFGLNLFLKKEDVLKIEMDKSTMRKGYFIIVAYILLSMVILALVIQSK